MGSGLERGPEPGAGPPPVLLDRALGDAQRAGDLEHGVAGEQAQVGHLGLATVVGLEPIEGLIERHQIDGRIVASEGGQRDPDPVTAPPGRVPAARSVDEDLADRPGGHSGVVIAVLEAARRQADPGLVDQAGRVEGLGPVTASIAAGERAQRAVELGIERNCGVGHEASTVPRIHLTETPVLMGDPRFGALERHTRRELGPETPIVAGAIADGVEIGTCAGWVYGGWLLIEGLWVAPDSRRSGIGRALVEAVEARAVALGAGGAHTDTFDFQAPAFWAALGYQPFGVLEGFAGVHRRWFVCKRLR